VLANESGALRGVMNSPRFTFVPRSDVTPEAELNALAAIYKFILFNSQSSKGVAHDLTNDPIEKKLTTRPEKKGKESAYVYRNRL
jgi:hypothetical protein